jgi:hypothetical protein
VQDNTIFDSIFLDFSEEFGIKSRKTRLRHKYFPPLSPLSQQSAAGGKSEIYRRRHTTPVLFGDG